MKNYSYSTNQLKKFLEFKAYQLRLNSLLMSSKAGSGHPTSCLSAADLVAALFFYAMEFDPADNDDYAMQQLDKRDSTAMAGVAWYHHERWGTVKASAAADVLDNSNGWVGELSVFHKMQIGRLSLTPALGVLYYDENFSDYYYGISESESRRSGLASYSAQDAWVPYVSLTAKYPIGEHVVLMASAGYSELPEEITDSPMIDRNESFTFVTGVSWRF